MAGAKVVVYGLSTEGYAIASQMAIKGADVSIIDESTPSAISLKAEIAKTYPNVSSLKEDEPLLAMEPIDVAISKAQYLFFTPRIRKTGQDIKTEIHSKFKELVKKYHPDKNQGNKKFEDKLKIITLAYSQLKKTLGKKWVHNNL